jgi:hypothetical protein
MTPYCKVVLTKSQSCLLWLNAGKPLALTKSSCTHFPFIIAYCPWVMTKQSNTALANRAEYRPCSCLAHFTITNACTCRVFWPKRRPTKLLYFLKPPGGMPEIQHATCAIMWSIHAPCSWQNPRCVLSVCFVCDRVLASLGRVGERASLPLVLERLHVCTCYALIYAMHYGWARAMHPCVRVLHTLRKDASCIFSLHLCSYSKLNCLHTLNDQGPTSAWQD